jgi:hypothetical protein
MFQPGIRDLRAAEVQKVKSRQSFDVPTRCRLFRSLCGYRLFGLYLNAEMLAQLPDVSHFVHSAATYPYTGLFDNPSDVGVLNLVALQTSHSHDILKRENSGHCETPCRFRGGNEDTR